MSSDMFNVSSSREERGVEQHMAEPLERAKGCLPAILTMDQNMSLNAILDFLFNFYFSSTKAVQLFESLSPITAGRFLISFREKKSIHFLCYPLSP